jgi:DNA invertase Pin-like site-specific DNA recombinase
MGGKLDISLNNKPKPLRCALYARVSLDKLEGEDERWQDPDRQLVPMRSFVELNGWQNCGEFVDRMSGKEKERPHFRIMLLKAVAKQFDIILFSELDRFSRFKPLDALFVIDRLKKYGVAVKSLTEAFIDTRDENPSSQIILYLIAWVAEQERKRISHRVKTGIANKKAKGMWHGGRQVGSKDSHKRHRRWLKKPDTDVEDLFK